MPTGNRGGLALGFLVLGFALIAFVSSLPGAYFVAAAASGLLAGGAFQAVAAIAALALPWLAFATWVVGWWKASTIFSALLALVWLLPSFFAGRDSLPGLMIFTMGWAGIAYATAFVALTRPKAN
jgi:hypothetical protein